MRAMSKFTLLATVAVSVIETGASAQTAMSPAPGQAASGQAGAGSASPAAPAQDARDDGVGDIVVTATRQSEALSRVPVSVAAYTQQTMDAQGVRRIDDIARLTPGLRLTPGADVSGNRQNISIRGISSNVGAATTGIYLDDTPIQVRFVGNAATNAYPQIFDLERVEVLRGPQGTLFGAGAEGGVVRFIAPSPGLDRYSAYARAEVGSTEHGSASYEAGAAIGGPIKQGELGFRVSGWYRRDGGYVDRVDRVTGRVQENDANSQESWSLRGAIKWQPTDALTLNLSVYHQDVSQDGTNILFESLSDRNNGIFRNGRVSPQSNRDRFTLPTLTVEYDAGFADVISSTSYFRRNAKVNIDYTNFTGAVLLGNPYFFNAGEYSSTSIEDKQRTFTQEVRIQSNDPSSRLTWVLGGFYSRARQPSLQLTADPFLDAAEIRRVGSNVQQLFGVPLFQGQYSFINDLQTIDRQLAGFAQVNYEVIDGLKVSAGARVAKTDVLFKRYSVGPLNGVLPLNREGKQSETPVTPKFGVSWQADRNNLFYASAAKGYRAGGINGPQIALCNPFFAQLGITAPESYGSDSVWSYELGSKNRLAGGKLSIDASVFHIDWQRIQRSIRISQCGSTFTTNLGGAKSDGFDLAINAQPAPGLTLGASVGYVNARLTESVNGVALNGVTPVFAQKGDKIGGAPWNFTLSGEYEFAVGSERNAYIRSDFQYTGSGVPLNYAITGADPTIPALEKFDQLSLRAGVRTGSVDLSLFVNNLLNEAPLLGRTRDSLASPLYFNLTARPRTFGLTASYRR